MLPVKQSPEEEVEVWAPQRLLGRLCPSVLASSSPLKAAGDVCALLMLNPQQTSASVLHANLHFVLRKRALDQHMAGLVRSGVQSRRTYSHLTVPRKKRGGGAAGLWEEVYVTNVKIVRGSTRHCSFVNVVWQQPRSQLSRS